MIPARAHKARRLSYNALVLSPFVNISNDLASALSDGLLVTANERLAREYRRAYDLFQQASGEKAWLSPKIVSLSRFFLQEYEELQQAQIVPKMVSRGRLLSLAYNLEPQAPTQLVQSFVRAFELCRSYDIAVSEIQRHHERGEFYARWASQLNAKIADNIIQQDIPRILLEYQKLPVTQMSSVLLEELTHAETEYFDWLCTRTETSRVSSTGTLIPALTSLDLIDSPESQPFRTVKYLSAQTFQDELQSAANWAVDLFTKESDSRIGIVVPTLASDHAKVCEHIGLALSLESGSDDPRFDASGGEALDQQAVWQDAALLLHLACISTNAEDLVALVDSSFFSNLGLSKLSPWPRSLSANPSLKQLARTLDADWIRVVLNEDLTIERTFDKWATYFLEVLTSAGWPHLNRLGSRQYQAYNAIENRLRTLPADSVRVDAKTALAHINLILADETFAPETPPANILVLGLLEANGLNFDHLWVCGLDDESFPSRNSAIPLIPRRIAKAAGIPRSDQDDELKFAERLLQRWSNQTEDLVVSFTSVVDDAERSLTRLLDDVHPLNTETTAALSLWGNSSITLESFSDDYGTQIDDTGHTKGGVRLLEDQAACPIKAYAVHRLDLTKPDRPTLLPDALVRGIVLHDALYALLSSAQNKTELQKVTSAQIEIAVTQAIQRLSLSLPEEFERYEKLRLANLVYQWLEVEALREEFDVHALESSYTLVLDRLQLTIRADRIDKLNNGSLIVIDYKTGNVSVSGIIDAPIARPQLPIYSLVEESIKGAFYAVIKKDDTRFFGVCDNESEPGGARYQPLERTWPEQIEHWKIELNRIARDFSQGYAALDPAAGACDYCHLASFCRIGEVKTAEDSG